MCIDMLTRCVLVSNIVVLFVALQMLQPGYRVLMTISLKPGAASLCTYAKALIMLADSKDTSAKARFMVQQTNLVVDLSSR